jgi:hypothetical protein
MPYPHEKGPMGSADSLGDGPIPGINVAVVETTERPGKLAMQSS